MQSAAFLGNTGYSQAYMPGPAFNTSAFVGQAPTYFGPQNPPNFMFRERQGKVNWRNIANLDLDGLVGRGDIKALESYLSNITFANIEKDDIEKFGDATLLKLFRLSQYGLEYLLNSQNYLANQSLTLDSYYKQSEDKVRPLEEQARANQAMILNLKGDIKQKKNLINAYQKSLNKPLFKCHMCPKHFQSQSFLDGHFQRRHSTQFQPDSSLNPKIETQNPKIYVKDSETSPTAPYSKLTETAFKSSNRYQKSNVDDGDGFPEPEGQPGDRNRGEQTGPTLATMEASFQIQSSALIEKFFNQLKDDENNRLTQLNQTIQQRLQEVVQSNQELSSKINDMEKKLESQSQSPVKQAYGDRNEFSTPQQNSLARTLRKDMEYGSEPDNFSDIQKKQTPQRMYTNPNEEGGSMANQPGRGGASPIRGRDNGADFANSGQSNPVYERPESRTGSLVNNAAGGQQQNTAGKTAGVGVGQSGEDWERQPIKMGSLISNANSDRVQPGRAGSFADGVATNQINSNDQPYQSSMASLVGNENPNKLQQQDGSKGRSTSPIDVASRDSVTKKDSSRKKPRTTDNNVQEFRAGSLASSEDEEDEAIESKANKPLSKVGTSGSNIEAQDKQNAGKQGAQSSNSPYQKQLFRAGSLLSYDDDKVEDVQGSASGRYTEKQEVPRDYNRQSEGARSADRQLSGQRGLPPGTIGNGSRGVRQVFNSGELKADKDIPEDSGAWRSGTLEDDQDSMVVRKTTKRSQEDFVIMEQQDEDEEMGEGGLGRSSRRERQAQRGRSGNVIEDEEDADIIREEHMNAVKKATGLVINKYTVPVTKEQEGKIKVELERNMDDICMSLFDSDYKSLREQRLSDLEYYEENLKKRNKKEIANIQKLEKEYREAQKRNAERLQSSQSNEKTGQVETPQAKNKKILQSGELMNLLVNPGDPARDSSISQDPSVTKRVLDSQNLELQLGSGEGQMQQKGKLAVMEGNNLVKKSIEMGVSEQL